MGVPELACGCLYTEDGMPAVLCGPAPPLDEMMFMRPAWRMLYEAVAHPDPVAGVGLDLTLCLPFGAGLHSIPADDLAALVSTLDGGGAVAIHGTHEEAVEASVAALMPLLGRRAGVMAIPELTARITTAALHMPTLRIQTLQPVRDHMRPRRLSVVEVVLFSRDGDLFPGEAELVPMDVAAAMPVAGEA